jgi:hypothetical protein
VVAHADALYNREPSATASHRLVSYQRDKKKFRVRFKYGGRCHHVGYYDTESQAVAAAAAVLTYWYGPLWFRLFGPAMDGRKRNPWQAVRWYAEPARPAVTQRLGDRHLTPGDRPKPRLVVPPADGRPALFDHGDGRPARPRAALPPRPAPVRDRYGATPVEGGSDRPGEPAAGWAVVVWEWGHPVVLGDHLHPTRPALDWPHRRRPWVWPTEDEAVAAYKAWRKDGPRMRWSLFSSLAMWR